MFSNILYIIKIASLICTTVTDYGDTSYERVQRTLDQYSTMITSVDIAYTDLPVGTKVVKGNTYVVNDTVFSCTAQ